MWLILLKKQKLTELENKIVDASSLATKTALTAVENKIPDVTTPESNTSAAGVFNAILPQPNLITKTDFDAKLSKRIKQKNNRKIMANETKKLLVENKIKKLKTFDSSYFIGKSHFEEDATQNYLVLK